MELPYVPMKKGAVAAIVGAAIGIGSAIYGAVQSAKKEKEAREKEAASYNANKAYFNRKMNESYADTAAGQNMIRQAREYGDKNWKKAQGAAAVGGGTDAATAMAKESGNKMVGETVAHMAANDTARKDAAGAQMASLENQHAAQQAGQLRAQGANIASAASGLGNAVGSAVSSIGTKNVNANSLTSNTEHGISQIEKSALNKHYENNPDEWDETKRKILGM